MARVLIAGGYGVVGGWVARHIRAAGHDADLILAGRNPDASAVLAAEVGASLAELDMADPAAGLAALGDVDLVISLLQDPDDTLLAATLRRGSAHIGIVRKCDNLGPTAMTAAILADQPALVMGHWQAGVMTLAALATAQGFARIDRIELAAMFDPADAAGPMSRSDSGAFFTKALMRRDGAWLRADQAENIRDVSRGDLPAFKAQPMGVLDVAGLVATTGARDLRFDIGLGVSIGTQGGGSPSQDIFIDIWGQTPDGAPAAQRTLLCDPLGQAHLTALGVLIGAERVLGLDGQAPPPPGLQFPERVIDPRRAVARLQAFGVRVEPMALPPVDAAVAEND